MILIILELKNQKCYNRELFKIIDKYCYIIVLLYNLWYLYMLDKLHPLKL